MNKADKLAKAKTYIDMVTEELEKHNRTVVRTKISLGTSRRAPWRQKPEKEADNRLTVSVGFDPPFLYDIGTPPTFGGSVASVYGSDPEAAIKKIDHLAARDAAYRERRPHGMDL